MYPHGASRGAYYYHPVAESEDNLRLMRLLDEQYLQTPFYGSRRMIVWLQHQGHQVNRKRVQRLMRQMGLEGIAPGVRTHQPRIRRIDCIRLCCVMSEWCAPIRPGACQAPTCRWSWALCILWPIWTGSVAMSWSVGGTFTRHPYPLPQGRES